VIFKTIYISSNYVIRKGRARHQWFMPVVLATREAEIRRITV
jgi:hypothetical protein